MGSRSPIPSSSTNNTRDQHAHHNVQKKKKKRFDPAWLHAPVGVRVDVVEKKFCSGCDDDLLRTCFSSRQLKKDDDVRRCQKCMAEFEGSWVDFEKSTKPAKAAAAAELPAWPPADQKNLRILPKPGEGRHYMTKARRIAVYTAYEAERKSRAKPGGWSDEDTTIVPAKTAKPTSPPRTDGREVISDTGTRTSFPQLPATPESQPLTSCRGALLTCSACDKTLPAEAFSQRQRREKEMRRCMQCVDNADVREIAIQEPALSEVPKAEVAIRKRQLDEISVVIAVFQAGGFQWMDGRSSSHFLDLYGTKGDDAIGQIPKDHKFTFKLLVLGVKYLGPCFVTYTLPLRYPYERPLCTFTCSKQFPHIAAEVATAAEKYIQDLKADPDGQYPHCIFRIHDAIQRKLRSLAENTRKQDNKHFIEGQSLITMRRTIISTHQITDIEKRSKLKHWASELKLGVMWKVGYKAFLLIEGRHNDVEEYITRLSGLKWKAMDVKAEDLVGY